MNGQALAFALDMNLMADCQFKVILAPLAQTMGVLTAHFAILDP